MASAPMEPGFQGNSFQPQDEEAWQVGLRTQLPSSDLAFQQGAFQEEPLVTGAGALASTEAFGRPTVAQAAQVVSPTGITAPSNTAFQPGAFQEDAGGSQALGSADVLFDAKPVGISSAAAAGTAKTVRLVDPVGVASAAAAGAPATIRVLAPVAIQSATAFGTPDTVRAVGPGGVASATAFGNEKVVRLVGPAGIASAEAWGRPTVGVTSTQISAAGGIASTEAFGVPDVVRIEQPVGIGSAAQPGVPNTVRVLGVTGIASAQAFGVPDTVRILFAAGIGSAEAVGQPNTPKQLVYPRGFTGAAGWSDETWGDPWDGDPETFGTPTVTVGVAPAPVVAGTAGGLPLPTRVRPQRTPHRQTVAALGIASAEAFGRPAAEPGFAPIRALTPDELAALHRIRESRQPLDTALPGIPSQERLGTATVRRLVPQDVTRAFAEYLTDPEAVIVKRRREQEDEELLLLELV